MCRKHHGSLFNTSVGVGRTAFRWLAGDDAIAHHRTTAAFERPFCRHCGSTVPALSHDDRFMSVPAGLLGGDPGARPRSHIFTASRSPLTDVDDELPRHAAYPAGFPLQPIDTPRAPEASGAVVGSCLCGAVVFAATVSPRRVVHCHCSLCRRSRAAAFSSTLLVAPDTFRWVEGAEKVRRHALPPPRQYATDFCGDCGSLVPSAPPGAPAVMLPAGAIDTPLGPLPAAHLYVGSKAAWYEIADAWPRFAELPPQERFSEVFQ
jgi:hypothetical protein